MMQQLSALVRLTVQDPRAAANGLLADQVATANAMRLAVLVVVLGVLLSAGLAWVLPDRTDGLVDGLTLNPILFAIVQFMLLMISVTAIFLVGRIFKGRGSFEQALLISVWLQFFMLMTQLALVPVALVAAKLADGLHTLAIFYFMWLMVNFIAELHGFKSRLKVLGSIVGVSFAASFLLLFLLELFGVRIEGV